MTVFPTHCSPNSSSPLHEDNFAIHDHNNHNDDDGRNEIVKLVQIGGRLYFGSFLLQHTLGEGEFGKVKLALHNSEKFAIKFIKKSILSSETRREKLDREIQILKGLGGHDHIIRLFSVLESEKYIGLVMEYASGGELFDHILAKKRLAEKEARKCFLQLVSGISYLHFNGIVHRDLKLENLLLDNHGNIKITDFGFANRINPTKVFMSTSCGSPCYAAPELVLSEKYIGPKADIWSCGVILYAMVCGYLPFDDDPQNPESSNVNLLYKYILRSPLKFPGFLSGSVKDLLRNLLNPDPELRYTMDQLQSHPWMNVKSTTTSTSPTSTSTSSMLPVASPRFEFPKPSIRGRASSAPSPLDEKFVFSVSSVFKKTPLVDLKLSSPSSSLLSRFGLKSIEEEASSPPTLESPRNDSLQSLTPSSNVESQQDTSIPSNNNSSSSLFSPITTAAAPTFALSSLCSHVKDRCSSNSESLNTLEDPTFEMQHEVKEHKGALDPKTISTRVPPSAMISIVYGILTASKNTDGSDSFIFSNGVVNITKKSPSCLSCTWSALPSSATLPNPSPSTSSISSCASSLSSSSYMFTLTSNTQPQPQSSPIISSNAALSTAHTPRNSSTISLPVSSSSVFVSSTDQPPITTDQKRKNSVGAQMKQVANSIKMMFKKREIKFTISACTVENLSGVFCLDVRRSRGDKWDFKRLYDDLISKLNFDNLN